jgi:hypothetical protein
LTLSAEGLLVNGEDKPVAFVFGPENGAITEQLVYEAARESDLKHYEHLFVIGFAIEAKARTSIENCQHLSGVPATYVQATTDLNMSDLLKTMRSSQIFSVCGLRRSSYELNEDGKFSEEVAKVFGVPFEVIPYKADPQGQGQKPEKRHHVYAVPGKARFEIRYPRVEGYTRAVRNRVTVDWNTVSPLVLDPSQIPPEVDVHLQTVLQASQVLGFPDVVKVIITDLHEDASTRT